MENLPVDCFQEIRRKSHERIFLFAEARSGSTWLLETLNSSPDISMLKEIMQPGQRKGFYEANPQYDIRRDHDTEYIERQIAGIPGKVRGCKILFPQAVRFMDLYEFLFNYPDARMVLLHRENLVKGEVSGFVAREFAHWHPTSPTEKHMVEINPEFLMKRVRWREFATRFCIDLIRSHSNHFFDVTYESLFSDQDSVLQRLCNFLEIPAELKCAREIKANPHPLNEIIANYESVKAYFNQKQAYVHMLD